MQPVQRATNVKLGYTVPRANVGVLNRGKPLENRPVINYTIPEISVDFYKSDSQVEQMLGLVNSSGVMNNLIHTQSTTATYGIRSMQVLFAPTNSATYNGLLDFKSGVLTSYALQGSVGEPMRGNFTLQGLELSGSVNLSTRDTTNIATNLVKPAGINLTGIQMTGLGLTGITNQSVSFSLGVPRQSCMQLGSKFPVSRPLTDVAASLTVQGWFDGINNSFTGLNMLDQGQPMGGTVGLTLSPDGGGSPTTVTMINPYWDGLSIESQVGGFSTFSISMSLPIGPNPLETADGSVLIFN